jgi:hypothetical protein
MKDFNERVELEDGYLKCNQRRHQDTVALHNLSQAGNLSLAHPVDGTSEQFSYSVMVVRKI